MLSLVGMWSFGITWFVYNYVRMGLIVTIKTGASVSGIPVLFSQLMQGLFSIILFIYFLNTADLKTVFKIIYWILTGKIPLTCHISCMDDIKGYAPVSWNKQSIGIFSVEMLCKLWGWHTRQEACLHATCRWKDSYGHQKNYINQERG